MTLQEFFDCPDKLYIHCKTEAQAIQLLERFHSMGRTWWSGSAYSSSTCWGIYCSETVYSNHGTYCIKQFALQNRLTVLAFDDIEDLLICPFCGSSHIITFKKEQYCLDCKAYKIKKEWKKQ